MVLSGRVVALLLAGLLPVVLRPGLGTTWLWVLVVALAVLTDWALAPAPSLVALSRTPSTVTPSSSASGRNCTRCRRVGRASAFTSSGVT